MPNLQELLPFYQQLFQQWTDFTMRNLPYAVTLVLLVWLITAIGYSISIGFLKVRLAREVKARNEVQSNLDATQQQLQQTGQQLTDTAEQLQQSLQELQNLTQHNGGLEQKLAYGGKKLVGAIAELLEKFELLDNSPAPQAGDVDGLWQRYDAIVVRVGERFQNEQQAKARLQLDVQTEKTKLVDKDVVINGLQGRLEQQTQKLAELEQLAIQHDSLQQELETLRQRMLIADDKRRIDSGKIQQLEKSVATTTAQPVIALAVEPELQRSAREVVEVSAPAAIIEQPVVEQAARHEPEQIVPVVAQAKPAAGKWKGMFGGAIDKFSKLDEKFGSPGTAKAVVEADTPRVVEVASVADVVEPVAAVTAGAGATKAAGFANKLGGMFGGLKTGAPKSHVVAAANEAGEAVDDVVENVVEEIVKVAGKKPGKLGGLLGKFKK